MTAPDGFSYSEVEASVAHAPGTRIGPYRLLRHLRTGGMAEVYEAVHEHLDATFALKVLSPVAEADPQIVGRFLQEGRALAQLEHPGIVRVQHCEKLEGGPPYVAMEHLHGCSLRDALRQRGRLPCAEVTELARQVAAAMAAVHARGIVHRDLKPENLFLVESPEASGGVQVKVLDFGISKVPASLRSTVDTQVQTAAPALLGTPIYMAPEQCRNPTTVTDRADVYALGVIVYELLTGQPPFLGDEPLDVMTQHLHGEPSPLRAHVAELPAEIEVLVGSMLDKVPERRPTMAQLAEGFAGRWSPLPRRCPLPGLQPFTEDDAALFCGREVELDALCGLLRKLPGPGQALFLDGPSGCGKTSLVQAGLLPRIHSQAGSSERLWRVVRLRPGSSPLHSLARALLEAGPIAGEPAEALAESLRTSDQALKEWMAAQPGEPPLLLILDQLEELHDLSDRSAALRFDSLIARLIEEPQGKACLLAVVRSEDAARLARFPCLARQQRIALRYHLDPFDPTAMKALLSELGGRAGCRLAEGLAGRMVQDVSTAPAPLGLLGQALRAMWLVARGSMLTHELYDELGGVLGSLENMRPEPAVAAPGAVSRLASLERAALAWELAGRPSQELPDGTRLADYEAGTPSNQSTVTHLYSERAQRFLQATQQAQRRRRRARIATAAAVIAAVLLAAAGGLTAMRERQHAAHNLQRLLQTADYLVSSRDWDLAQLAQTQPVRQEDLRRTEQQLRELTPEEREDGAVREALIQIQQRQGDLSLQYGLPEEAEGFYRTAQTDLDRAPPQPELTHDWQLLRALNDSKRGKLALAKGLMVAAQQDIDRSVQILEHLYAELPDEEHQRSLATGYSEQGLVAQLQGQWTTAAALYARHIALIDGLPRDDYHKALLVLALGSHAEAAAQAGDEFSSRRSLAHGLALSVPLAQSAPANLFFRWGLARLYLTQAAVESAAGRRSEAAGAAGRALSLGRSLHNDDKAHRQYRRFLAQVLFQSELTAPNPATAAALREERCGLISVLAQRTPADLNIRWLLCP